jgi:hypothetical protein
LGGKILFSKHQNLTVIGFFFVCLTSFSALGEEGVRKPVTLIVATENIEDEKYSIELHSFLKQTIRDSRKFDYVELNKVLGSAGINKQELDEAQTYLNNGIKAYDNLDLEEAHDMFLKAIELLEKNQGEIQKPGFFTKLLFYTGAVTILMGKSQKIGRRYFRRALLLDSKAELDPMMFPPSITSEIKNVSEMIEKLPKHNLSVYASPKNAEVWIDGKFVGISPLEVPNLSIGTHFLRLIRRGHEGVLKRVVIVQHKENIVELKMESLTGLTRYQNLVDEMVSEAGRIDYPQAVQQFMEWAGLDRLMFVKIGKLEDNEMTLQAYYYDRFSRSQLKELKKTFALKDPKYRKKISAWFAGLQLELDKKITGKPPLAAVTPPKKEKQKQPGKKEEDWDKKTTTSIFNQWWFWAATGVLAAGAVGLAIGLSAGENFPEVTSGQVIMRF